MRKRYSGYLKKIALIGWVCFFSIITAEAVLRVFGISHHVFHQTDPVLGVAHIPGAKGWYVEEGKAWVEINSQGLRDREHLIEKPPGVYRIAVLGDSYAAAFQVPVKKTFWHVMGTIMNSQIAESIEVINFGVGGYGTAQQLLQLRHDVKRYDPDLVLLAFLTGNDVSDNVRDLKGTEYIPYYVYDEGELVLDDSFKETPAFQRRLKLSMVRRSRILQMVNNLRVRWRARNRPSHQGLMYMPPQAGPWADAWRITERLIIEMSMEHENFMVVTLSNADQVHPHQDGPGFYPDLRIGALGARIGFPVLNLAQPMSDYAKEHNVYLHGFDDNLGGGHWNDVGHIVAGGMISRWLRYEIFIRQKLDGVFTVD